MPDIYTDTYANIPAAGTAGDLFLPSDGFAIYRDTGAAWAPWGPYLPHGAPPAAGWAWVNQGAAAVSTTEGGILLSQAAFGGGLSMRIRIRNAPATPYTITAHWLPNTEISTGAWGSPMWGLCFRQSSDGKLATMAMHNRDTTWLHVRKYTDETTYSAQYGVWEVPLDSGFLPYIVRIADDGANRVCSYSTDGQHFHVLHTVGRTDFLTADQVGFFINPDGYGAALRIISWKEE